MRQTDLCVLGCVGTFYYIYSFFNFFSIKKDGKTMKNEQKTFYGFLFTIFMDFLMHFCPVNVMNFLVADVMNFSE